MKSDEEILESIRVEIKRMLLNRSNRRNDIHHMKEVVRASDNEIEALDKIRQFLNKPRITLANFNAFLEEQMKSVEGDHMRQDQHDVYQQINDWVKAARTTNN